MTQLPQQHVSPPTVHEALVGKHETVGAGVFVGVRVGALVGGVGDCVGCVVGAAVGAVGAGDWVGGVGACVVGAAVGLATQSSVARLH